MKHQELANAISRVTVEYCMENEVSLEDLVDVYSTILLAASPFNNISIEFDKEEE